VVREVSFQAGAAPAHLVNDLTFNFYQPGNPDRMPLPVSMVLSALVRGHGTLTIASSAPVSVRLGSRLLFDSTPPPNVAPGTLMTPDGPLTLEEARARLQQAGYGGPWDDSSVAFAYVRTALAGGWRVDVDAASGDRLELEIAAQDVSTASLQVGLAGLTPFTSSARWLQSLRQAIAGLRAELDLATLVLVLATALHLSWRAVASMSRGRQTAFLVGVLVALLYGAPHFADWLSQSGRLIILSGGDDWLTYESFARDIRHGSLLMLQGQPLGKAAPFYYQALYPYFLAAAHFAVGESVQAIVLVQMASAMLVITMAALALPETPLALVAFLLAAAAGIVAEWFNLAGFLLSENLLLLLLAVLLLVISRLAAKPTGREMALLGLLLGLAVLTRSTAWLAAPFVLLIVSRGPDKHAGRRGLLIGLSALLLLAILIPFRNLLATGVPTPIPTSGSINVSQGFVPPGRHITTEPWLRWSQEHDANLVASAEAIVDAPGQVALKLLAKLVYVLGFPRSLGAPDVPLVFFPVFLLWLLALPSLLSANHSRLAWCALALALSHAVTLVLIFPNNYYYRLLIPAMLPLAIWDALGLLELLHALPEPSWLGRRLKPGCF